jgi:hypothetical protein
VAFTSENIHSTVTHVPGRDKEDSVTVLIFLNGIFLCLKDQNISCQHSSSGSFFPFQIMQFPSAYFEMLQYSSNGTVLSTDSIKIIFSVIINYNNLFVFPGATFFQCYP